MIFNHAVSWLKTQWSLLPEPLTDVEYSEFKEHSKALCFFDKLPEETKKDLSGVIWHFEPRTFITQIQKAERRLIFETVNKMNNFIEDDMRHGDMTKEEILAQGKSNEFDIFGRKLKVNFFDFDKTIDEHFESMKSMGFWTAWGEYAPLIKIMIEKFRKNEGGVLRHELLNKAFLEHQTTKDCIEKIKGYIRTELDMNRYNSLSISNLDKIKDSFRQETIGVKLPKFDSKMDGINGLEITIHDTYSTEIYLDYLDVVKEKFEAKLNFKIQDHFGLDIPDLNGKGFELSPWFCSWFILQRYKQYGYKPFINEASFSFVVKG